MKLKFLIFAFTVIAFSQNAFAGTGAIQVEVERVSIIGNVPYGGHLAGNMEIKILNGFTLPTGVSCNTNYITTKKINDPDREMLKVLEKALSNPYNTSKVQLWITDNSVYTAYTGRCSLAAVNHLNIR